MGLQRQAGAGVPSAAVLAWLPRRLAEASAARPVLAKCPRTLPPLTGPWGQGAWAGPGLESTHSPRLGLRQGSGRRVVCTQVVL